MYTGMMNHQVVVEVIVCFGQFWNTPTAELKDPKMPTTLGCNGLVLAKLAETTPSAKCFERFKPCMNSFRSMCATSAVVAVLVGDELDPLIILFFMR